jgi:hypothetical protein
MNAKISVSAIRKAVLWCRQANGAIFYSESRSDWAYLGDVIFQLQDRHGVPICYLTSDPGDPALRTQTELLRACYVGSGLVRIWLFQVIDVKVMVMTLPDLHRYSLRRSFNPVHYVYLFHALNSTHMSYRHGAFDSYDSILCAGPHHINELQRARELYSAPNAKLVECGYPRVVLPTNLDSQGLVF